MYQKKVARELGKWSWKDTGILFVSSFGRKVSKDFLRLMATAVTYPIGQDNIHLDKEIQSRIPEEPGAKPGVNLGADKDMNKYL